MKLIKLFLLSAVFAWTLPASAADWSLKINSFARLIPQFTIAEICGTLTGPAEQFHLVRVEVIVDPQTQNPATYTVNVDRAGNFCHIVNAYSGRATARLWNPADGKGNDKDVFTVATRFSN